MHSYIRRTLILLACLALMVGVRTHSANAEGTITLSADKTEVDGNERFTVSVDVDSTTGLFAAQLSLAYVDADLNVVEVRTGDVWPAGDTFVIEKTGGGGSVEFAATLTDEAQTVGAGTLVTVIFEAENPTSQITTDITNGTTPTLILSDLAGNILSSTAPDDLTITVNPAPEIEGTVMLQAPDSRTITINAVSASLSVQGGVTTTSGVAFSIALPSGNDYKLTATAPCHLSAETADNVISPSTGHDVTLIAGDVNGDNVINIQDLSAMGSRFGGPPTDRPCADLIGDDDVVNIRDLSRAGSNFGESGPSDW